MMNHDGSQQYTTFGYGLASTPQIQLQQQHHHQQLQQLQQHHFQQQPQILQPHQGNPTIAAGAQNVFQLQVGGNHQAAAALLQQPQNDTTAAVAVAAAAAAASPTIVQHGLISQPLIHANLSVSLDNNTITNITKPLPGLNNGMEASIVYQQQQQQQQNGLKILTNSSSFVQQQQQQQPQQHSEIHFQSLDNLGKSGTGAGCVFDGMASVSRVGGGAAAQSAIGTTTFGKQSLSGWVQQGDGGGNQQYSVGGQNALPSFGHLWSQFQQQKTQVNIVQQQQQLNQFQPPHLGLGNQQQHHQPQPSSQPFTVSGMQNINNIQMFKVQQTPNPLQDQTVLQPAAAAAATHIFQSCAATPTPVQRNVFLTDSSSLIQRASSQASAVTVTSVAEPSKNRRVTDASIFGCGATTKCTAILSTKRSSKNVQRKLKASQAAVVVSSSSTPSKSSPSAISSGISTVQSKENVAKLDDNYSTLLKVDSTLSPSSNSTVRIKPSNGKSLSESGPPKVTVTLDSLASNNINNNNDCNDELSHFPGRNDTSSFQMVKVSDNKMTKLVPRNHFEMEKHQPLTWHQAPTRSHEKKKLLASSNHLISSTGSSLDHPSSEDSNFSSPPPYSFTPPSSLDSVFSPPPMKDGTHLAALNSDIFPPSISMEKSTTISSSPPLFMTPMTSLLDTVGGENSSANNIPLSYSLSGSSGNESLLLSSDGGLHSLQTSVFTNSLMSASCCSIAITTTSVTSSSPRTNNGDIAVAASVHSLSPLSSPGISARSKSHRVADGRSTLVEQVRVPYSWQRNLEDGLVIYVSPSGVILTSLDQISDYLLSHDTCKCGLECPFQLEEVFVFDPAIGSLPWGDINTSENGSESNHNPMGNLCNHRREILAMAAFHQSQTRARQVLSDADNAMKGRKRERKKSLGSTDDFVISPLKKLRTRITNAVNKHAMLRNNSPASCSSIPPSPVSELESYWQKDDDVFFPVSSPLSSCSTLITQSTASKMDALHDLEEICPTISTGLSRCFKDQEEEEDDGGDSDGSKIFSAENLVYSNHHPSQRLVGTKERNCHQEDHQQMLQSRSSRNSSSSSLSPRSPFLPLSSSSQQNKNASGLSIANNAYKTSENESSHLLTSSRMQTAHAISEVSSTNLKSVSHKKSKQNKCLDNMTANSCKSKKGNQKHRHRDFSSGCCNLTKSVSSENKNNSSLSTPNPTSTSISFLENPTEFVAKQTTMINNSMSSCNPNCTSPMSLDHNASNTVELIRSKRINNKSCEKSILSVSEEEAEMEDNQDRSREEEEEQKGNTDVDSNKSFSDTTENNDSAYLSQTGSDQEKSDTVDGLDCLSKSSDVYDFNTCEDNVENVATVGGGGVRVSQSEMKSESASSMSCQSRRSSSVDLVDGSKCEELLEDGTNERNERSTSVGSYVKPCGIKTLKQSQATTASNKKTKVPGSVASKVVLPDASSISSSGSLNKDLSQLLASNNWNIPSLQKVLAQHSAGDPEHLRQVVQQMMTDITACSDNNISKSQVDCQDRNGNSSSDAGGSLESDSSSLKRKDFYEKSLMSRSLSNKEISIITNVSPSSGKDNQPSVAQSEPGIKKTMETYVPLPTKATTVAASKQESLSKPLSSAHIHRQSTKSSAVAVSDSSGNLAPASTGINPSTVTTVAAMAHAQQSSSSHLPQTSIILSTVSPHHQLQTLATLNSSPHPSALTSLSGSVNSVFTNNLSKPSSLMTQVISNNTNMGGINNKIAPQFLGTPTPPPQSRALPQLLNPHHHNHPHPHQSSQNSQQQQQQQQQPQQIMSMNALSIPGLNNPPLFISNNLPIPQASPSSITTSQLSPAMAGHILAAQAHQQTQQQQQQMSPSFVPTAQIAKPCSASISSLALSNNASTTAIPIVTNNANNPTEVSRSITQQGAALTPGGGILTGPPAAAAHPPPPNQTQTLNPQNSVPVPVPAANGTVYSATNQPVFVIPQAKPVPTPPVVQLVGGSSQSMAPAATNGLQPTDLNMNQLMNQAAAAAAISADQNQQLQNLINAASGGFNPAAAAAALGSIQQQAAAWNAVNNLTAQQQQQQQQQQLQLLQLQQLMLPAVIGTNQAPQPLPSVSVSVCPSQSNSLMNAMVSHQHGLQINQVVDVKTIQQNFSPAAAATPTQGFNNPALSPIAAQTAFPNHQLQQLASPLTVQVGSVSTNQAVLPTINSQVSLSKPVNILQPQSQMAGVIDPSSIKKMPPVLSTNIPVSTTAHIAHQPVINNSSNNNNNNNNNIIMKKKAGGDKEIVSPALTLPHPQQHAQNSSSGSTTPANTQSTVVITGSTNNNPNNPSIPPSTKSTGCGTTSASSTSTGKSVTTSKSKSKSKKSDGGKVKDPQLAKDEEQIFNTVNQILAQAVQQQRELTLAAQNAPPPPPKSRNRKRDSQARARQAAAAAAAAFQAKEQELGKIASISDDVVFHQPLQLQQPQAAKALPSIPPPLPNLPLPLSSPLSLSSSPSSVSSFPSPTAANVSSQEQPLSSSSLSNLVNNNNINNSSFSNTDFAMISSQSNAGSSDYGLVRPSFTASSTAVLPSSSLLLSSSASSLSSLSPPKSTLMNSAPLLSLPSAPLPSPTSVINFSPSPSSSSTSSSLALPSQSGICQPTHKQFMNIASEKVSCPSNTPLQQTFSDHISPSPFRHLQVMDKNSSPAVNTKSKSFSNNTSSVKNNLTMNNKNNALINGAAPIVNDTVTTTTFRKSQPNHMTASSNSCSSISNKNLSSSLSPSSSSKSTSSPAPPKKSSISLKEHLSSIVFSKDKDSGKRKGSSNNNNTSVNNANAINTITTTQEIHKPGSAIITKNKAATTASPSPHFAAFGLAGGGRSSSNNNNSAAADAVTNGESIDTSTSSSANNKSIKS